MTGSTTQRAASPIAAWPTLVGIQLVIIGALIGLAWRAHQQAVVAVLPPPSIEVQLQRMDLPSAMEAIDARLAREKRNGTLGSAQERHLKSFLSLTAHAAGLEVQRIDLNERRPIPITNELGLVQMLVPVEVRVGVSGDLFDIPVFLEGINRQRVLGVLQRIAVSLEPYSTSEAEVLIRYHRPLEVETDWITERLSVAAPGADRAAPVLEKAAEVLTWKKYQELESALRREQQTHRQEAARVLPIYFISLLRTGGELVWTEENGVVVR